MLPESLDHNDFKCLGKVLLEQHDFAASLATLESLYANDNIEPDDRYFLGDYFLKLASSLGDFQHCAVDTTKRQQLTLCMSRAIELQATRRDITSLKTHLYLSALYLIDGSVSLAEKTLNTGWEIQNSFDLRYHGELIQVYIQLLGLCPHWEALRKKTVITGLALAGVLYHQSGGMEDVKKFDEPIAFARRILSIDPEATYPEYIEGLYAIAKQLHFQSNYEEAVLYIRKAQHKRAQLAQDHPLNRFGIRIFHSRSGMHTAMGHLCSEIDTTEKAMQLGWYPRMKLILLAPERKVANGCILDYHQRYTCVVTDPSLVKRLEPLKGSLEFDSFWLPLPNGYLHHYCCTINAVQVAWESKGKKPLYKLTSHHRIKGKLALRELGLPEGAWFVTMHVRDVTHGKKSECQYHNSSSHRDSDIETYTDAIKAITDRGGWVIRLGDSSMKLLKPHPNCLDYAHSPLRKDWLDVYLIAQSRFYFGTASGVSAVATNFGVPVVLTNASPTSSFSPSSLDIFIPKRMRSRTTGTMLNLTQSLNPPLFMCHHTSVYEANQIEIIDNTSSEITDVVNEMLDRCEGIAKYTDDDRSHQNRFREIASEYAPYGITACLGRDFIRSHPDFLN